MLKPVLLLVLLTVKGDGQPPVVNFVEMPDLPACEARAKELRGILEKGGIAVRHARCVVGIQQFTPHRHRRTKGDKGAAAPEKKHVYLVALGKERVLAVPQPSLAACERAKAQRPQRDDVRYFCAVSDQRLLGEGERGFRSHMKRLREEAK